jgi:hypothetical protein
MILFFNIVRLIVEFTERKKKNAYNSTTGEETKRDFQTKPPKKIPYPSGRPP